MRQTRSSANVSKDKLIIEALSKEDPEKTFVVKNSPGKGIHEDEPLFVSKNYI